MKKLRIILHFLGRVFCVFGVTVAILAVLCALFGEMAAKEDTGSLFRLGGRGLSLDTLAQFLATSLIITLFNQLFMSEWMTKRLPVSWRNAIMILGILLIVGCFIIAFDWFPVDMWEAWLGFFLSFGVCFTAGTVITRINLKGEDSALEAGFARLREEWEKENRKRREEP